MPPQAKHNQVVIILDMKMAQERSFLLLDQIILHKMANYPKDFCKLIMLHTETTNNSEEYKNIVSSGESLFDLDIKSLIGSLKTSNTEANWLEALDLAVKHLYDCDGKNIINKQIVFITDFARPLENIKEKLLNQLIAEMNESLVYFYIFGPEVTHQTMITRDNIEELMQDKSLAKLMCDSNYNCAIRIIRECSGVISTPELGLGLLTMYTKPIPKQTWKVQLSFKDFKFPTLCEKIIFIENQFAIDKIGKEQSQFILPSENTTDVPKTIGHSDVISVCKYLDKIVYIDDVADTFKFQGEAMLKIIGFINSSEFPELFFTGADIYKVYGNKEDPNVESFYQLVRSTAEKNKYVLVLKSHFKNAAPKQFILVPKLKTLEFIMIGHPELVGQNCHFANTDDIKTTSPVELLDVFRKHLKRLSSNLWPLHPTASIGPHTSNYFKNIMDLVEKRESKEEVKKVYELGALGEMMLKYRPQQKVAKSATKGVLSNDGGAGAMDADDDDEDW